MKCISIRQPWAWLIVRPDLAGDERERYIKDGLLKDIENRVWPTRYRGPILIHAAKGMTKNEYESVADQVAYHFHIDLPPAIDLQRGGIVGRANIIDCQRHYTSKWFIPGGFGFKLDKVEPVPFQPLKGELGLFDVDVGMVA